MKVDEPRFQEDGLVECEDCPCDEEGVPALSGTGICCGFRGPDGNRCPTKETYSYACALAEAANIEEVTK